MSAVDDILFEPIGSSSIKSSSIDYQIIDAVKICLADSHGASIEFMIDAGVDVRTYEMIADLVENDSLVVKYTNQMVTANTIPSVRPHGALGIKDVFRRIHAGEVKFWFCGRANGHGVRESEWTNWFGIDTQIPIFAMDDGNGNGGVNIFEWWLLGLMSQFTGYTGYYAFATEAEANKYYALP